MSSERIGDWLLDAPDGAAATIDLKDGSHHFDNATRHVYAVSNVVFGPAGVAATAATLHRAMANAAWSYEITGPGGFGWAKSLPFEDGWYFLQTTREADGLVLSCTISFRSDTDREWALAVWRGIRWSPI